jgi:putative transposase
MTDGLETQGIATAGSLTAGRPDVAHLCHLARISRAGFYRHLEASAPKRADTELRDAIQRLALAHRHYGYRRIAHQLRREGEPVNHKRVLRLMREDNLLCLRAKPYVPRTTDSRHGFRIVPNLIRDLVPSGPDQIWVADLTYIRLSEDFVYLAVILDAFSRRIVGWALDDHLQASLALAALDMAILARKPEPGHLIHHSDRGVQYACQDYGLRLEAAGVRISMSGLANPYDNAKAESFMKTLKTEEVNGKAYRSLDHARRDIGRFLDFTYNTRRLHSAIDYKPPAEFEADFAAQA